jgi:penicillin-binding protein 1A
MAGSPATGFFRPPSVTGPTISGGSNVIGVSDYLAGYPPVAAPTASTTSGAGTDIGDRLMNTIKSLF